MREHISTRIVCTLGPRSWDRKTIEALLQAGMKVVRLNMSHGTLDEHRRTIKRVREASAALGLPVAILQDLGGPKLRLGELEKPVDLSIGDEVVLTSEAVIGSGNVLPVVYDDLAKELNVGDTLSLADGVVGLEVIAREPPRLTARVLSAGAVRTRQGVHLPTGGNTLPVMTERDEEALCMGLEQGVDWVAMSFVRQAGDAKGPRRIMKEMKKTAGLIAKIERKQAVENLDAILETFDALMVARGDLGVEMPLETVPGIQKDMIRKANLAAKPVITATQMLLSMVDSPVPTRAEVNDVANAIIDGTDAVMLSEETARGKHPVRAVQTMVRIAREAEKRRPSEAPPHGEWPKPTNFAIARASRNAAEEVHAALIVVPTTTGSTARLIARCNPTVPILALLTHPEVMGRMLLVRGVIPRTISTPTNADELFDFCLREARASGLVEPGQKVVITAGFPLNIPGNTSLLQIMTV